MRDDEATKRAEGAEDGMRGAVEKYHQLISIQEAQAAKIKELEALLEESKATVEAAEKRATEATSKVVVDFRASVEYEDEQVELSIDVYDAGRQSVQDRVAAKYPEHNPNFLDEI